jgi:hypothetical protein
MRACEVHRAAELLLGAPLRRKSVKAALAARVSELAASNESATVYTDLSQVEVDPGTAASTKHLGREYVRAHERLPVGSSRDVP